MDRTRRAPRGRTRGATPTVAAPPDLRSSAMRLGAEEYVVLSYPLPELSLPEALSGAEREVALLLLAGDGYAQIAARRRTALRTVANQVASIFRKVGVRSRLELAVRLARPGGEPPIE